MRTHARTTLTLIAIALGSVACGDEGPDLLDKFDASVIVGNGCCEEPKVLWPAARLLLVPATSRRPNDNTGLTGSWPASAIWI